MTYRTGQAKPMSDTEPCQNVDTLVAEVERLRSGITEVIEDCLSQPGADHDFDHDPKGVVADVLTALLNPTEGET